MNPHFLFNAHNSIRSMILIDKDRAWQMITELSEFFVTPCLILTKSPPHWMMRSRRSTIISILKIRYRDSLEVVFHIEEAARKCSVPAFLFQPVIENAIKYGMQTSPMPLQVVVSITLQDNTLSIDVSNTGKLVRNIADDGQKEEVHGTSLENIKQRLRLMFEEEYGFQLYEENGWVHSKIRIHYQPAQNGRKARLKINFPVESEIRPTGVT
jgi:LytS/YehU family sensor histidine kinase